MKILVNKVSNAVCYNSYLSDQVISFSDKLYSFVDEYIKNYNQDLYFVVCLFENTLTKSIDVVIGSLNKQGKDYTYKIVEEDIKSFICSHLNIKTLNDLQVISLDYNAELIFIPISSEKEIKIKKSLYSVDSLKLDPSKLHHYLVDLLFDRENILHFASTRNQIHSMNDDTKEYLFYRILKKIGFVKSSEINISSKVLAGDIGELMMGILMRKYFVDIFNEGMVYPKLAYKTNPNSPVNGVDGSFYLPDNKHLYHMEAKFYTSFNEALKKACDSLEDILNKHDDLTVLFDAYNLRDVMNNMDFDPNLLGMSDGVEEKFVIFIAEESHYKKSNIKHILDTSEKYQNFKSSYEVIFVILPVFDKKSFMEIFAEKSKQMMEIIKNYEK